jgi:hypothetical protein
MRPTCQNDAYVGRGNGEEAEMPCVWDHLSNSVHRYGNGKCGIEVGMGNREEATVVGPTCQTIVRPETWEWEWQNQEWQPTPYRLNSSKD